MRFLLNENIPRSAVEWLSNEGHDTVWVTRVSPGLSDTEVLALAVRDQRVVVTMDRDYGDLLFRVREPAPPGVLYLRGPFTSPEEMVGVLSMLLSAMDIELMGFFTRLSRDTIRQRALP